MVEDKVTVEDQGIWMKGLGLRMREDMWAAYRAKILKKMRWWIDGKDSEWVMKELLEEKIIADGELEKLRTDGW